jgi:hypothetical protein
LNIPNNYIKYAAIGLFVCIVALLGYGGFKSWQYNNTITDLQNVVALKDKTIETHVGNYEKLAFEHENLKALLDKQNAQMSQLQTDLGKRNEELLTANQLTLFWKQKYASAGTGTQTTVPGTTGQPAREKVAFSKDFGYLGVSGWTLTNPPEYSVEVQQNRPLTMTLVVGQLPDGSWKANVVSSEENVGVDIKLAAVNPHVFDEHWYEKIGLSLDMGVGAAGFLGGVGASYQISNFEVGPKVWLNAGLTNVAISYGAGLTWHPFFNSKR